MDHAEPGLPGYLLRVCRAFECGQLYYKLEALGYKWVPLPRVAASTRRSLCETSPDEDFVMLSGSRRHPDRMSRCIENSTEVTPPNKDSLCSQLIICSLTTPAPERLDLLAHFPYRRLEWQILTLSEPSNQRLR